MRPVFFEYGTFCFSQLTKFRNSTKQKISNTMKGYCPKLALQKPYLMRLSDTALLILQPFAKEEKSSTQKRKNSLILI
jgi:hypothetical protein